MESNKEDKEIKAMADIISSLEGLDAQARERVFKYVGERLGVTIPSFSRAAGQNPTTELSPSQNVNTRTGSFADIRSLKEEKRPDSVIQMTALVAYYLQNVAAPEERKDTIGVEDIKTYFNQAGYPLPKVPKSALNNTKAAGYLESADRGRYRLNPVGYNLVAYGLPAKTGSTNAKRPKTQKTTKGKKAKK